MRGEKFQPPGQSRDELLAEHERLERRIATLKRAREDITHDLGEALRQAFVLECQLADGVPLAERPLREDGAA